MSSGRFPRSAGAGEDLAETCRRIGEQLDEAERRIADDGADIGYSDAEQLDHLALQIEDLLSHQGFAPDRNGSALASLYEAPFSDPAASMLDELAERVELLRGRAWMRVGVPFADRNVPGPATVDVVPPPPSPLAPFPPLPASAVAPSRTDPWRIATEVPTAIGVMLVLFVLYATIGSGLTAARTQRYLARDFNEYLLEQTAIANIANAGAAPESSVGGGGSEDEPEQPEGPRLPAPGDPVATLSLPTIGVRHVVVEGTTAAELTAGPGHLRSTPLPGRVGNSVIFGRRTTYGGPFGKLDDLRPGDPVDAVTVDGLFRYVVQSVERVATGEPDPIGTTFSNRLTLVTADEGYSAGGRLVAIALLDGAPAATPTTPDGSLVDLPSVGADDIGTQRTGTDWALLLLWSQVMVILYLGARWLYRHWLPWSTWVASAPVLLVVAFAWFDSAMRMLPSTL
jgi:sortase A